jgi:hypothetical protein
MAQVHSVEALSFDADSMHLVIDGKRHCFRLADISQALLHATPAQREIYDISPSGYGIHWPLLDEDLSIDGLLGIDRRLPKTGQSHIA